MSYILSFITQTVIKNVRGYLLTYLKRLMSVIICLQYNIVKLCDLYRKKKNYLIYKPSRYMLNNTYLYKTLY